MASFNLSEIEQQLQAVSKHKQSGVSFSGKALKLNEKEDASDVIEAIRKCDKLEYLNLEGNTLGPKAAEEISKALSEKAYDLKRALWKDMFTGRMKDEIPLALQYLGKGLCDAKTQLIELDLSDNAFGPIGVKGLASLLSSSSCYTLQELRLNNNGLGTTGGKLLATALLDCNKKSLEETKKPLSLKVFVAGRNRLENEGAEALAKVFETLKSLEEVVMPQNGIYHIGIAALATALSSNTNIRILNLNDNTVAIKGANALAKVLPSFTHLEQLNLGDCLLKTEGASVIAETLSKGDYPSLTELNLSYNEIRKRAVMSIISAVENKSSLTSLLLDGNFFGQDGRDELHTHLTNCNLIDALGTLDEDATDDDESEDENKDDEQEENESTDEESKENSSINYENDKSITSNVSVNDFLKNSTGKNLLLIQGDKSEQFIDMIKRNIDESNSLNFSEELIKVIMKVSALCESSYVDVKKEAYKVTNVLYEELFKYAINNNLISMVNNILLIHLGLIKTEDKSTHKIDWNLEGCFKALEEVTQKDFFPHKTRETLKLFITKSSKVKDTDSLKRAKDGLKTVLDENKSTECISII